MQSRVVGLGIFGFCVLVTLVAAAIALGRGTSSEGRAERGAAGLLLTRPAVALIKLDGAITDAMVEPQREGRDNVYAQLRRAEQDRHIKAVVLRINSPGGSAAASQALYDQIRRMRTAGKKVVVHFTDVAASGGYYVGAAADRIVSQPATITGSIGVIIVSADLRGLYEKIGYRERIIKSGPYKDILSASRDPSPEEQAILEKLVQDTLDQFVKVVAEGRNLPEAAVWRIADGRIFSGTEALNQRLVDEVGDQYRAIRLAAELAGLQGEPQLVIYRSPRSAGLLDLLGFSSGVRAANERLDSLLPRTGTSVRYEWRG